MSELGDKLRQAREANNLTRKEAASLTGIGYNTICDYEKGASRPDVEKLALLCAAYKTPADFFINVRIENSGETTAAPLSPLEKSIIDKYRCLDDNDKQTINNVIQMAYDKTTLKQQELAITPSAKKTDKGGTAPKADTPRLNRKYPANVVLLGDYSDAPEDTTTIPVYDAGASAGTGIFLDSDDYDVIAIPDNYTNRKANFAVWVDGHSMEPRFSDGDLVLVRTQPTIDVGEIGIFIVNGEGFIKKLGEGELISLNPEYKNIPLNEWDEIYCKGKVLGKL